MLSCGFLTAKQRPSWLLPGSYQTYQFPVGLLPNDVLAESSHYALATKQPSYIYSGTKWTLFFLIFSHWSTQQQLTHSHQICSPSIKRGGRKEALKLRNIDLLWLNLDLYGFGRRDGKTTSRCQYLSSHGEYRKSMNMAASTLLFRTQARRSTIEEKFLFLAHPDSCLLKYLLQVDRASCATREVNLCKVTWRKSKSYVAGSTCFFVYTHPFWKALRTWKREMYSGCYSYFREQEWHRNSLLCCQLLLKQLSFSRQRAGKFCLRLVDIAERKRGKSCFWHFLSLVPLCMRRESQKWPNVTKAFAIAKKEETFFCERWIFRLSLSDVCRATKCFSSVFEFFLLWSAKSFSV